MNIWKQAPLVRLIIPFLAGILTAIYFPFQGEYFLPVIVAFAIIIASIVLIPKLNVSYRKSWWFGGLVSFTLFAAGCQLTILKTEKFRTDHFFRLTDGSAYVHARVAKSCVEKERSVKTVLEITEVKQGSQWHKTSGKAMVYFKKNENALRLKYGDQLLLKTNFTDVSPPQNPAEFDYKKYLEYNNIYQQAYVASNSWTSTGINSGNTILSYCISLREKLLNTLSSNNIKGDEYAVGAALLLGYSDKLDAEIISAYAGTGALHVLSVSGLHVAIVYAVFNWLLFFLDKFKRGNIIKAAFLLLLLWFYSALTGLSPSVLRAATMFSFIVIAKSFNRHTNIYNTLAASAFLLLLFDPYLIMNVGFQLSYIAVIGIVYIQPKIYNRFEFNRWLPDQIWLITTVSIAAQIATFPLGLYYFHQFPNYFLLSNFIVIPLSTLIIYLGIALFSFSGIAAVTGFLAVIFSYSVWLLNSSVKLIEQWPYALLSGISISALETWIIYGTIILSLYYFAKPKFQYLMYLSGALILLLCLQIKEQQDQYHQKKLIVYNIPKTKAIDFIDAKNNLLYTDSAFTKNESQLLFHIKHNWWELGIDENQIVSKNIRSAALNIQDNFIQFYDKRIIVINNENYRIAQPVNTDYIIISKDPKIKMKDILKYCAAKKIIFDSSNSIYKLKKWKEECIALHQPYYAVADSGAFVVDL